MIDQSRFQCLLLTLPVSLALWAMIFGAAGEAHRHGLDRAAVRLAHRAARDLPV